MNKTCQSRSCLEHIENNFVMWVTEEWVKVGALLHLTFTNKKGDQVWNQGCKWQEQPCLQWVQDHERREQGKKQDHNPGLQESRVQHLQRSTWKGHMGHYTENKRCRRQLVGYSKITSSKLMNGPSQWAGSHSKVAGVLRGWTKSSWQNSDIKRKHMEGESRDKWLRKNIITLSECAGMGLGKPKPVWSWICQVVRRATRKGRLEKVWACYWMRKGTWWQRTWRRPTYSIHSHLTHYW